MLQKQRTTIIDTPQHTRRMKKIMRQLDGKKIIEQIKQNRQRGLE